MAEVLPHKQRFVADFGKLVAQSEVSANLVLLNLLMRE